MILSAILNRKLLQKPFLIVVVSLIISVVLFYIKFGFYIILPDNNAWLTGYDYATHYLGWLFFRNEPWGFPLGAIERYFYPLGANIGYTDSIPLMAFFGKIISGFLSDEAQYLGFWLFLSYLLQGFFAALIVKKIDVNFYVKIFFCALIIFSPILLNRHQHPALCAHWLILAGIWLYLMSKEKKHINLVLRSLLVLNILAAFIHPYMSPLVFLISLSILFKAVFKEHYISRIKALFNLTLTLFFIFLIWYVVGFFSLSNQSDYGAPGYGWFSANLNALYNSNGYSNFSFMSFSLYSEGQLFEGFNYLGLGLLFMMCVAFIYAVFFDRARFLFKKINKHIALVLALLFISLFAITNIVTLNNTVVFSFDFPNKIDVILSPFRSSGRFFWLTYYFLITFVFFVFASIIKKHKFVNFLIPLFFLVQVYDIKPLYKRLYFERGNFSNNNAVVKWKEALGPFEHIVIYPPFEKNLSSNLDYVPLSYIAALQNKSITTGYLARYNAVGAENYKLQLEQAIINNEFDNNTVYLTHLKYYNLFSSGVDTEVVNVSILDSVLIFYLPENDYPLLKSLSFDITSVSVNHFFKKYCDGIVLISAKDEATMGLTKSIKDFFTSAGVYIDSLDYRGSLAAILYKGQCLIYGINNFAPVILNLNKDNVVNGLKIKKDIFVESQGYDFGNLSSILVDNKEYSLNQRGLNVVVLDTLFNVIQTVNFDTHIIPPTTGSPKEYQ